MNVFNQHKVELIKEINKKIDTTDKACARLSRNIHQYSQKRMSTLKSQREVLSKEIETKQLANKYQFTLISDLVKELAFQKQEQDNLLVQLKKKEQYEVSLRKEMLFMQQKLEQEQPHFKSYLTQNEKCKKANGKVEYAKYKLKQLELKYKRQCQQVQYKYKLVQLMKQTLRQRQEQNKSFIKETSRIENQKNSVLYCQLKQNAEEEPAKQTQLSENFIQSTIQYCSK